MDKRSYINKVGQIDMVYDIGLRQNEFNRIIAKFEQQKASFDSDDLWESAVRSAMQTIRDNPLEAEIKKMIRADNMICPICHNQGEPITLMRGKKAYFCKSHRVVLPAVVEG